jgi:hypothetical protein
MKIKQIGQIILVVLLAALALTGCGGGEGAPAPASGGGTPTPTSTKAIVTLTTTGTLPAGVTIGGIGSTVTYATNKGLTISDSNVVASGAAVGSTLVANTNTAGQVTIGLISASGIQAGEFATLTFSFPAGSSLSAADFSAVASLGGVIGPNGPISGLDVAIKAVTFQ